MTLLLFIKKHKKTQMPVSYQEGKIYKIISDRTNLVYIGSTTQQYLSSRLVGHMKSMRTFEKNGNINYKLSSFEILKHEDHKIVLIENYPCNSKNELFARERYWIENTPNTVNKHIPTKTYKEYRDENREYINEINKKSYVKNKDKRQLHAKEYREQNKEIINEQKSVKFNCDCGSTVRINDKARHIKTLKHQEFLKV